MIYPKNFETKLGFDNIRSQLKSFCLSTLGKGLVEEMRTTADAEAINHQLAEIREMRRIVEEDADFPLSDFHDVRDSLKRIRLQNTWMEEKELFDLGRSLKTIDSLVRFLYRGEPMEENDDEFALKRWDYPALHDLADGIATFPVIIQQITQIIDKTGNIRDNASPELARIRLDLAQTEHSISKILNGILRSAQADGLVDKDTAPAMRDGRLVIPVSAGLKRRIPGIVHDESATGRTAYIEPTQVVEANNKIRELEAEERQEIIRILIKMADRIRPHAAEMLDSFRFLAEIDLVQAKAAMAKGMDAFEPEVADTPIIDWIQARHPLLEAHLRSHAASEAGSEAGTDYQPKKIIPLDITLTPAKRILIISGPNAGGKSVCLKTTGLLQYMLQSGLSIPVSSRSKCGVFRDIMADIGDEQSLENDLSTYSSHLLNMKNMLRQASAGTLILIDEFGSGTEPQIGGAIAEAVLDQFCRKGAWAVITTHYQNLKHFADSHEGVANGAMLYDRHEMRPLFQLAIGRPGSSFAIEIARRIGLPEAVIKEASDIVGSDYIQSDKYLQDIVRDKRYWEQKRQTIHQQEKELQQRIARYEGEVAEVDSQRKDIIANARQQAQALLAEANKRIENTIREIREKQAEKEATRKLRAELDDFKQDLSSDAPSNIKSKDANLTDEEFQKKVAQIKARKQRHEERKRKKERDRANAVAGAVNGKATPSTAPKPIVAGDTVRIRGLRSVGQVESISGTVATVAMGGMRTKVPVARLEHAAAASQAAADEGKTRMEKLQEGLQAPNVSHMTRDTIDEHTANFRQDLDVRGMRGDEALGAVRYFIDDALVAGVSRVRILHGKGDGILRQLIRQYLSSEPAVSGFRDEDVRLGGAGITVVDL